MENVVDQVECDDVWEGVSTGSSRALKAWQFFSEIKSFPATKEESIKLRDLMFPLEKSGRYNMPESKASAKHNIF